MNTIDIYKNEHNRKLYEIAVSKFDYERAFVILSQYAPINPPRSITTIVTKVCDMVMEVITTQDYDYQIPERENDIMSLKSYNGIMVKCIKNYVEGTVRSIEIYCVPLMKVTY